jgi:CHAD domain-containing protein
MAVRWDEKAGASVNARRKLPDLASKYFVEVRKALRAKPTPAQMHRVRLASKRFRYTLELFKPCYAAGLERRLGELRKLQDILGALNDATASGGMLEKALSGRTAERARVKEFLEQRMAEKTEEFRRHWSGDFDAPGKESWWVAYLARNARAPVKGK